MPLSTVTLLTVALLSSFQEARATGEYDYVDETKVCPVSETIVGGTVSYSEEGSVGSVLTYHCREGFQPYPVSQRTCGLDGEWHEQVVKVICIVKEEDYGDYEEVAQNCSVSEVIQGGRVTYSSGGLEGSVATFHCEEGHYPYPASTRVCLPGGMWSALKLPSGKLVSAAKCKEVLCPGQLQLDHGYLLPRKDWFQVGDQQEFSCDTGFILIGSATRNCTQTGSWTGTTPVCDDQADDCGDPGVPPGAMRTGQRFRVSEKVRYRCHLGLELLGPVERTCLESREWSGSEPGCVAWYMFDSPGSAAQAMSGSLSAVMEVSSPVYKKKEGFGRTLKVAEGRLNIFILLDTSGSISKEQFDEARNATADLIRKLDSYEVNMKFEIISFASQPISIVSITDVSSGDVLYVLDKLMNFNHSSHGKQTGTNLYITLQKVYDRLIFLREKQKKTFHETQNVILLATDGHANMGHDPTNMLDRIRELLGYKTTMEDHTEEELFDVYVFGIGDVNKKQLNSIASMKRKEKHLFILKNYVQLGKVFNMMISDSSVTMCGVAQEDISKTVNEDGQVSYTRPWHVEIIWVGVTCQGSILSENWVITAAHCLTKNVKSGTVKATAEKVSVKHGEGTAQALSLIVHAQYNVSALQSKNVKEFYDYDIALIKVEPIKLSWRARPICLPCTNPSNRALKMSPNSTCEQHERSLLWMEETQAHFINLDTGRKQTHIQTGRRRTDCIAKASSTFSSDTKASVADVITDRFMCTGGSKSHRDAVSCKGDSGGSLFLRKGMRYFQVAVLSWGTSGVCDPKRKNKQYTRDEPPPDARDFHISVFSLMPWLKQHLAKDIDFLPMSP